ncbi:MAG: hypothetical protein U5M51_12810 [Emticicia sp.]|nr:hypothetical protein [Emticicia sp.]
MRKSRKKSNCFGLTQNIKNRWLSVVEATILGISTTLNDPK